MFDKDFLDRHVQDINTFGFEQAFQAIASL